MLPMVLAVMLAVVVTEVMIMWAAMVMGVMPMRSLLQPLGVTFSSTDHRL